ncbi:hypothetical protein [Lacrimispora sp.]|uniref:hypothetical protein n=1 Tax=Lacrimispora sp. TaxID=2719234 RepID=UPI000446C337|nr:hypothetical protein [Lacrimispora sp.]EXG85113.1 hypothetical protein K413DRAFT_1890 [Clostridium sp. ASBs410]
MILLLYFTSEGNSISLSYALSNLRNIAYFTLSEEGIFTCDENGENPRFKELQFSKDLQYQALINELKPYKKTQFIPEEWFLRPKVSDEHKDEYFYRVIVYYFNELSQIILSKYTSNIVFRDESKKLLHLPQDLCFFNKDGELLIGTLSHEDIAAIKVTKPLADSELSKYNLFLSDEKVVIPQLKM